MANLNGETLIVASRDSLLALAQSIEAAQMLRAHGAMPRILTLKTSGDLKLDAPLYDVAAAAAPKEGRAFFTRELDDALISGKADIAVHSFKDLPTEAVAGVGEPIFFSEASGADILLSLQREDSPRRASKQMIGTSSLRRIHQLKHAIPGAETVTLRGNIVTRLRKLHSGEGGMNAILIAGAGIRRLQRFANQNPDSYSDLLDSPVLEKIAKELAEFKRYMSDGVSIEELDELLFPTAPGQGVLALQMSTACEARLGDSIRRIFAEHSAIAPRVGVERGLMAALGTGCHAPLGVSALERSGKLEVSVCFSRKTQMNPPAFSDSVYLHRQFAGSLQPLITESRYGFGRIFWWGLNTAPQGSGFVSISALKQKLLNPHFAPVAAYGHIFVSSPAAIGWLKDFRERADATLWAAGAQTAKDISLAVAGARIEHADVNGFAGAFREIRRRDTQRILWLGSASGLDRAKLTAGADAHIDFLPVYENVPADAAQLLAQHIELSSAERPETGLHLLTSRASAAAFAGFARVQAEAAWQISCFGESAAEQMRAEGFRVYHSSNATTFEEYQREINGDTTQMRVAAGIKA